MIPSRPLVPPPGDERSPSESLETSPLLRTRRRPGPSAAASGDPAREPRDAAPSAAPETEVVGLARDTRMVAPSAAPSMVPTRFRTAFSDRRNALRALGTLALAPVLLSGLAAPAAAQSRPDQVLWTNPRGRTVTDTGKITENSLEKVVIDKGRGDKSIDVANVQRVVFGDVPPSFTEGTAYFDRRQFAEAAKAFQLAAGDASARDIVKARARLSAAQAYLQHGAQDPSAFAQAQAEVETFISDYSDNRELPEARLLLGRAQRLSGDAAAAAKTYADLFGEAAAGTSGYPKKICFRAGVGAAEAYIASGDAEKARGLYGNLESAVTSGLADLDERSPDRREFLLLQNQARLGEGFCLLAKGSTSQAKTFFKGRLDGANGNAPLRHGARLGLAEALLAEGKVREAQIEFAQVSAIDHTDRDRVARALVGLAQCSLKLSDKNANASAKRSLETVRDNYGDTPSVLRAQELLQTL